MSPAAARDQLEIVASQWIALWCAPVDWQLFDRLHADDFEDCASAGRPSTKAGFGQGIADLIDAFPDLCTTVEDLVVDEARSRIAVRWAARGTNRSEYRGVGPIVQRRSPASRSSRFTMVASCAAGGSGTSRHTRTAGRGRR
jgi:predicted ester cyclase